MRLFFKKFFEWPQAVLAQSETGQCSMYKLIGTFYYTSNYHCIAQNLIVIF